MTEELVEKMVSTLAGLKTDLYGIKVALILISVCVAVLVFFIVIEKEG